MNIITLMIFFQKWKQKITNYNYKQTSLLKITIKIYKKITISQYLNLFELSINSAKSYNKYIK